jgi:hypothetical protein
MRYSRLGSPFVTAEAKKTIEITPKEQREKKR